MTYGDLRVGDMALWGDYDGFDVYTVVGIAHESLTHMRITWLVAFQDGSSIVLQTRPDPDFELNSWADRVIRFDDHV